MSIKHHTQLILSRPFQCGKQFPIHCIYISNGVGNRTAARLIFVHHAVGECRCRLTSTDSELFGQWESTACSCCSQCQFEYRHDIKRPGATSLTATVGQAKVRAPHSLATLASTCYYYRMRRAYAYRLSISRFHIKLFAVKSMPFSSTNRKKKQQQNAMQWLTTNIYMYIEYIE